MLVVFEKCTKAVEVSVIYPALNKDAKQALFCYFEERVAKTFTLYL